MPISSGCFQIQSQVASRANRISPSDRGLCANCAVTVEANLRDPPRFYVFLLARQATCRQVTQFSCLLRMRSRLSHTRENLSTLFCNPSTPECLQKETNDGAGFCQVAENTEYRRYFFLWPLPCCDCTGGSYPAECRCAFAGADLIANASHVLVSLRMQRVGKLPMHFTQSGSRFLGDRTS